MPSEKSHSSDTPKSENGKSEGGNGKPSLTEDYHNPLNQRQPGENGENLIAEAPEPTGSGRNKIFPTLPPLKYSNKKWYVYDSDVGCYQNQEDNYICHLVQKILGPTTPSYQIQDEVAKVRYAVHFLERFHPAIRFDDKDILINVLNGLTRVKPNGTHSLEPHDEKWCFNGVLPVEYNLEAKCPIFRKELSEKLPDPLDQKLILYFGAYSLIPDCRFGVTLFNYGPSHTGKSTLIVNGLGSVFGDQIGCLKLNEICPENYSGLSHIPTLQDKLLNIGAEVDGREVKDTTNFKRLISGEEVMARGAYERGGRLRSFCKLAFNMNELPKINGTTAESFRIRIVSFEKVTEEGKRDFLIEKQIKLEGSGIYMLLLEQMAEVLALNEFPFGSNSSQWVYEQLKEKIDPYTHFIQTYKKELELGSHNTHTMQSTEIDTYVIEFLKSNDYESIFHLDVFKRRLYARFNIKSDRQWRPEGAPRNQQKKVSILHGICKR